METSGDKDNLTNASARRLKVVAGLVLIAITAGVAWFFISKRNDTANRQRAAGQMAPAAPAPPRPLPVAHPPGVKLPGEAILSSYASPTTRPQDDLHAVAHALANLALLIKGDDPFRMGANEEFAEALRGRNRTQLRFLPDDHPAFNEKGQLIDRWKTPLYIHAASHDRLEIRSAGPDQKMWTEDDLQRQPDGQFLKGASLNPTSLYSSPQTR